jgi:rare lipoprotein A (peptidoglycan hydrolase)
MVRHFIPKAHAEQPADADQHSQTAPQTKSPTEPPVQQPQSPTATELMHGAKGRSAARAPNRSFSGKASFYSYRTSKTASGSWFNRDLPTAAHRNLPFGTKVRVTNLANNKSVVVTITDRGPKHPGRVLDLSLDAARVLGITDREGVAQVRGEVL